MNVWRRTVSGWCYRKAETEPSGGMSAFELELLWRFKTSIRSAYL